MRMRGNTIFITGGTSGIGRGLAEAFHNRGNQVIIAGRREERLKQICTAHPGMRNFLLDVTDAQAVREIARRAIAEFPAIDCVINNAGVQKRVNFVATVELDDRAVVEEIHTNLLGPIRVAAAFLPHLERQSEATLVNVSSGLAFVPMARFPVYCATKAAVHSWTVSLRHQLRHSGVKVIEIIPPWVATELGSPGQEVRRSPAGNGPMPLDAFIAETMRELESGGEELAIADAKGLVAAAHGGAADQVFARINS